MRTSIIIPLVVFLSCFVYAGDSAKMLYQSQEFATLTSDTSSWFKITNYEKQSIFIDIGTDSANFDTSGVGDSLNAHVLLEYYFGSSAPSSSSGAFWSDGASAQTDTLLTITIADTLNGGRFAASISPNVNFGWGRVIVKKNTGHVLSAGKVYYDLGIWLDKK